MRKRTRILTGVLAGCLIMGQTVFAEEAVADEQSHILSAEETQSEEAHTQTAVQEAESSVNNQAEEAGTTASDLSSQAAEIDKTLYVGLPYHMEQICDERPWYFTVESSDSAVCEVSEASLTQPNGEVSACFNIEGVKAGKADITLWSVSSNDDDGEAVYEKEAVYHIEVKDFPEDAVPFKDPVLIAALLEKNGCDKNEDGYISKTELAECTDFHLSRYDRLLYEGDEFITDLSGMEYAANATSIDLYWNLTLENIDALAGLEKLNYLNLESTAVSDETRWEFAAFDDIVCEKGGKSIRLPKAGGVLGSEPKEIVVEELDNQGVIDLWQNGMENPYFYSVNTGTATLRVTWRGFSKEFTVTVAGIDSNQALDAEYSMPVQMGTVDADDGSCAFALKENGELWELYPEMKLMDEGVAKLVDKFVIKEDGSVYAFHEQDQILAKDIVDMAYYYDYGDIKKFRALTKDGKLCLMEESGELSLLDTDVKQITNSLGYLKNTGELFRYDGNLKDQNVEYLTNEGYYTSDEGFIASAAVAFGDPGDLRVKKYGYMYHSADWTIDYDLAITEDNEVWALVYRKGDEDCSERIKLGDNCADFSYSGDQWDWVDTEGNYYKWDEKLVPTEDNMINIPVRNMQYSQNSFGLYAKGDQVDNYLYRNYAEILSGVQDLITVDNKDLALRIDGSIWDVTDRPVKIGTLNTGDDYIRGDITGDGSVQIDDLRMILRSVCGKVELTEQQKLAADVETDGEVNISDLRKVLRFVCGKIETL